MDEEIVKSIIKRAKGYRYQEVQEEYSYEDGKRPVLTKKKVAKKYCPPDASALKVYMDITSGEEVKDMSDEELERERDRLIAKFVKEKEKGEKAPAVKKSNKNKSSDELE